MKGKHVDIEVLRILVKALSLTQVCSDILPLRDQALRLFGRLTSQVLELVWKKPQVDIIFTNESFIVQVFNHAEIWKLYADLIKTKENKTSDDHLKIISNLQTAHRVATQEPNWESNIEQCKIISKWALELAEGTNNSFRNLFYFDFTFVFFIF